MDRITLPSGKTYDALWAGISLATGNINASLLSNNFMAIVNDFNNASPITIYQQNVGETTYEGYTRILRLIDNGTGYQITLAKEV